MLMLQLNPKETDITNGVKFTNITNITLRRASTHRVVREVVLCLAAKKKLLTKTLGSPGQIRGSHPVVTSLPQPAIFR